MYVPTLQQSWCEPSSNVAGTSLFIGTSGLPGVRLIYQIVLYLLVQPECSWISAVGIYWSYS